MKCKKGQLAFIKKAIRKENIGRVVTCVKYLGYYEKEATITINGEQWSAIDSGDFWLIEGNIETMYGASRQSHIPDHWLSPLDELPPEELEETDKSLEDSLELVN